MADVAPIAGPEAHRRRAPRTCGTRKLDITATRHVLVDGQRAGPYDGHWWKHRLGPPPPQCQLVRRGSLAFRDRSSFPPQRLPRPIASSNSVADAGSYITVERCRQHPTMTLCRQGRPCSWPGPPVACSRSQSSACSWRSCLHQLRSSTSEMMTRCMSRLAKCCRDFTSGRSLPVGATPRHHGLAEHRRRGSCVKKE